MPQSDLTYYDLLGVSSHASDAEIERAYRALLVKVHPDISRLDNLDTHRLAALVNQAWLTLHDPAKRKAYDESLRGGSPETATPKVEELSDRARAYVEQLERSRALWDETRRRAEGDRVSREREALALAHARETAQLAGARRIAPVSVPARFPRVPWSTVFAVVAVVAIVASGLWFLLRPQGGYHSYVGRPPARSASRAPAHVSPTSKASAVPAQTSPPVHKRSIAHLISPTAAPLRPTRVALAPISPGTPPPHQAPTCVNSQVSAMVGGTIVVTGAGSYRIDNATMQRQIHSWTAGDAVTICTQTAPDGSSFSLLADGVRGTVQGVAVRTPPLANSTLPVCTTATVTRVVDDGATVQTSDGRTFHVDGEGMRTEARSWGTPAAVKICTTIAQGGIIHASIVASDTISVQATEQRSH